MILTVICSIVIINHGYLDCLVPILRIRTKTNPNVPLSLLPCAPWVLIAKLIRGWRVRWLLLLVWFWLGWGGCCLFRFRVAALGIVWALLRGGAHESESTHGGG